VITPGAEEALRSTRNHRIGVIGTEGTVRSQAYTRAISKLMPDAVVFSKSCPLFVPLVEEGWTDHPVAKAVVHEYLHELQQSDIDTLVLGCTHYPLLRDLISQVMGNQVTLVDSAVAITAYLKALLPANTDGKSGKDIFYVSDNEDKFEQIAKRILDKDIAQLRRVRLFESWFE